MPSLPDRPAVLTDEMQQKIVELLAQGNFLTTACNAVGISVQTFNYWRRLFEGGAEHAQKYADFFAAVKKAASVAESQALSGVRSGVMGWQGEAWFLERRFPKRWGRKPIQQATPAKQNDDDPIDPDDSRYVETG